MINKINQSCAELGPAQPQLVFIIIKILFFLPGRGLEDEYCHESGSNICRIILLEKMYKEIYYQNSKTNIKQAGAELGQAQHSLG